MATKRCQLCDQDISKPSMVRCGMTRCPAKSAQGKASSKTLMGIGALGLGVVGACVAVAWAMQPAESNAVGKESVAEASSGSTKGKAAWVDKMINGRVGDDRPVAQQAAATIDPLSIVDPRAASRVQTFDCSSRVSPARARVCSNWDLAIADYNVSILYANAMRAPGKQAMVRRINQRRQAELDRLEDVPKLVLDFYADWQAELSKL